MSIILAIKQYLRDRISRIVASDTADVRPSSTIIEGKIGADVTDVRTNVTATAAKIALLQNDLHRLKTALREQRILPPEHDQLLEAAFALKNSAALREDFESYKDNRLLQRWNSAVGLPSVAVQGHIFGHSAGWDPDLDGIEADLLRRCDLLPPSDRTRLIITEFLIACGRTNEAVTQILNRVSISSGLDDVIWPVEPVLLLATFVRPRIICFASPWSRRTLGELFFWRAKRDDDVKRQRKRPFSSTRH